MLPRVPGVCRSEWVCSGEISTPMSLHGAYFARCGDEDAFKAGGGRIL